MIDAPPVRHLVGGQLLDDPTELDVVDPSTGEVVAQSPAADERRIDEAVRAARRAFPAWRGLEPGQRSLYLLRLADAVADHAEEFARLESVDVGKPITAARAELPEIVDSLRFMAAAARTLQAPAAGEYRAGHTSLLRREPLGVVGLLTPWNYPLMVAAWKLGAALAAGNCAVLKPSETTPLSAGLLAQLAAEVLPAGVLNVVFGPAACGAALVGHPLVAMVSLTGGSETGRRVASAAAVQLQRVSLELGGNAPVVILADADLDEVAMALRVASFANAGQDCTAASRVIVDRRVAGELEERLVAAARSLTVGPTGDPSTELGPLVSGAHRDHVARAVAGGGGEILTGGGDAPEHDGFFYAPTVVGRLEAGSPLIADEIFGPVVTIETVDGPAAAVAAANRTPQGLAASVWTRDGGRALAIANELECGVVWVNAHTRFVPEMPHSGVGESGYGADLSVDAVSGFTQSKHVMIRLADLASG